MSDSLRQLEEKIAYLERHVLEQDKAMLAMSDQLDRVKRELSGMRTRLVDAAPGAPDASALQDERPPHY